MTAVVITLHPQMTAVEIAAWCQEHRMFVTINYITGSDGVLMPLITARREHQPDHVPAFLRLQAD